MKTHKIVLTGSFGVGKTSLFHRFIYDKFEERYSSSIGVRINQKTISLEGDAQKTLELWDLAGEVRQEEIPRKYFEGTSVILYIFDISRPFSYRHLSEDVQYLKTQYPDTDRYVVCNKIDLKDENALARALDALPVPVDFCTSAREGTNVEAMFYHIGSHIK